MQPIVCHCTKLPHIHFEGREGYVVVTDKEATLVATYEEGREVMQTKSGKVFLYYHCKPIKGLISDRGNVMHLTSNETKPIKLPPPRTEWDWYSLNELNN